MVANDGAIIALAMPHFATPADLPSHRPIVSTHPAITPAPNHAGSSRRASRMSTKSSPSVRTGTTSSQALTAGRLSQHPV